MKKLFSSKFYLVLLVGVFVVAGIIAWNSWSKAKINSITSGVKGSVLLDPQCPVVRVGEDCPDKPYATTLVVTTTDQSKVIKDFKSDENGMFSVQVSPGEYAIRSAQAANIRPYCSSRENIIVSSNAYTETVVYCDTGIR